MSRSGPIPICHCGHSDRWHKDYAGNWVWCSFKNEKLTCLCTEFKKVREVK